MITKDEWNVLYNEVFKIIPPSDKMNLAIYYDDGKIHYRFTSMSQLFVYLSLKEITMINDEVITYYLRDDTLYDKIQNALKRIGIIEGLN